MEAKKVVFLDINVFAREEFTSGLLITIREILKRLSKAGANINILSVAQGTTSRYWEKEHRLGQTERNIQGINVKEILLENTPEQDFHSYLVAIRNLLGKTKPDIIIMNTPGIFLEEINIRSVDEAIKTKAKVITLIVDELFPTIKSHPKELVQRYYNFIGKTEVIINSKRIQDNFYNETGIRGKLFPNLFPYNNIISKDGTHKYITLINHHPIKGREIFDSIARKMPSKKFMVVENWPDVPSYIPPKNVKFSKFIRNVPALYSQIRILLVPSLCEEGPARVIMESLINGIPVIAHNIGSIYEIGKNYIHYIKPPSSISTRLEGTIVYPEISSSELNRVVNDFIKVIEEIDKNQSSWVKQSLSSKKYAIKYCEESEKKFKPFLKHWLKD